MTSNINYTTFCKGAQFTHKEKGVGTDAIFGNLTNWSTKPIDTAKKLCYSLRRFR